MPKPSWMTDKEKERFRSERNEFKRCVNCSAGGDPCGQTNYIPKVGRLTMYQCRRHPTVKFYRYTLACEDFEARSA